MPEVNAPLLALFQAHGIECATYGEGIALPGRSMKASAAVVSETQRPGGFSIQLDVRLEIPAGHTIIESFAGIGETRERAVADAFQNFTLNVFHVLLGAFFRADDEQVSREEWVIGGMPTQVTIGNVGVRGRPPVQGEPLAGWFKRLEEKIKEVHLSPGTHWVRLYYGQMERKAMECEVLLDNDVWDQARSEMAAIDWPSGDAFYSVRVFLILRVGGEAAARAEAAVARLAEIVAANPALSEDQVHRALTEAGVPAALADRAYKFTQIAWGRALLDRMGVRFSPDYMCLDAGGTVVETGRLADEPCFAAASRLSARYAGTPAFRQIAMTSGDVHGVNAALNAGSKPEDLVTAPAFVFVEAPTEAGLERARRVISEQVESLRAHASQEARADTNRRTSRWWRRRG